MRTKSDQAYDGISLSNASFSSLAACSVLTLSLYGTPAPLLS